MISVSKGTTDTSLTAAPRVRSSRLRKLFCRVLIVVFDMARVSSGTSGGREKVSLLHVVQGANTFTPAYFFHCNFQLTNT